MPWLALRAGSKFSLVWIQNTLQTATMGRKLIRRMPTEKDLDEKSAKGHIAIIIAQHLLVCSSGYVVASTAYLIHIGTITRDLLPAAIILVFAVCIHEHCEC